MSSPLCHNPNHPDYKNLVKQVKDENLITLILSYYGEKPLSSYLTKTTDIKKALTFPYTTTTDGINALQKRIRLYNVKHGTSHSIDPNYINENVYQPQLLVNYLPVNITRQMLRDTARAEDGKVNQLSFNFEVSQQLINAFENTNEEKIEIPFKRDLSFYKGDAQLREQEEGIDEVDYMLPDAGETLSRQESKTFRYLNKQMIAVRRQMLEVETADEKIALQRILENLKKQYNKSEQRKIVKKSFTAYEDVLKSADIELRDIAQLLSNQAVKLEDVLYASEILNFWLKAGDFSTDPSEHPLLDEDEFNSPVIREEFRKRLHAAEDLNSRLDKLKKAHLVNFVRSQTSQNLSVDEIFKSIKDLGKIPANTLWLGRVDDAMVQSIAIAVDKANKLAEREAQIVFKKLDDLSKLAIPVLSSITSERNPYAALKQYTSSGKETGRMIHLFSHEFFTTKERLANLAFNQRDKVTGVVKKNDADIKAYYTFLKENTISFDVRILFPDVAEGLPENTAFRKAYPEGERERHIEELKKHLGEKQFEKYYASVEKKINQFKIDREAAYKNIQHGEQELSDNEKEALFNEWNREHSPYWALEMQENPETRRKSADSKEFFSPKEGFTYLKTVPRRFTKDGKQTEWYDKNFQKIENNDAAFEFYNYITETLITLKKVFPEATQKLLGVNVLPYIEKTIMDNYAEKGMFMGYTPLIDSMVNSLTTSDLSKIDSGQEKSIQIQFVKDHTEEIKKRLFTKVQKQEALTGTPVTSEELRTMREEAIQEISQEKSWDIVKIMKAYSLMALGYKQKSIIEPQIKLAMEMFKQRKEVKTNKAGEVKVNDKGIADQEGLKTYQDAIDFYVDAEFFNIGSRKVEGPSKKRMLTTKEKQRRKEILEIQESVIDEAEKQKLEQELKELGSPITTSGVVDSIMKYNLLTSLGWNIPSAINNIGFGVLANIIEAASGTHFSTSDMRTAYMLTFNSIGRNTTFNTWEGINGNALKIRALMDRGNHLKTSAQETYDLSNKSSLSKLKRFGPMSMQERSEYLNIAPVMIATMMNFKATSPDGKEVTYWDALDREGNLKEGYTTDVDEIKLAMKVDAIVQSLHGDYAHKLKMKETSIGRVLSQFRTWMMEGFANRFEAEKSDYILSYGLSNTFKRKGRYRSYSQGQLSVTGATIGTMVLPGIGTAIGAGAGYISGKLFGIPTEENALSDTLFTLKQLFRKATFRSTQFNDRFDEVDAANMRKNMQELYIYIALYLVVLGIAGAAGADDDEEKNAFLNTMLINQGNRLLTDVEFYTNPLALEKITKSAVPATRILQKTSEFFKAVKQQFDDDPANDVLQSGPFKDENKAWSKFKDLVPGLVQIKNIEKFGTQVFDK